MKKIKRNLLLGASTLMFVGAMFVFADTNAQVDCSTKGKSIKKWCDSGTGNCICTVIITPDE